MFTVCTAEIPGFSHPAPWTAMYFGSMNSVHADKADSSVDNSPLQNFFRCCWGSFCAMLNALRVSSRRDDGRFSLLGAQKAQGHWADLSFRTRTEKKYARQSCERANDLKRRWESVDKIFVSEVWLNTAKAWEKRLLSSEFGRFFSEQKKKPRVLQLIHFVLVIFSKS